MSARLRRVGTPLAIFVSILVVLGTWVVGVPRFGAPDEPAHMYKAYGTVHGELLGQPAPGFPANLREYDGPASLGAGDLNCFVGKPQIAYSCVVEGTGQLISSASPYPPYYYAAVGGPARLVGEGASVRAYRAVSALLCGLALTWALMIGLGSRRRRFLPLVLVTVTPTCWSLMGAISPNAFEIACFAVLWAMLARVIGDDRVDARLVAGAGSIAGLVVLLRPVAFAWLVPVAVCTAVAAAPRRRAELATRRHLSWLLAPTVIAGVLSVAWLRYAEFNMNDERTVVVRSFWETVKNTASLMDNYLRQTVGELGWVDTTLPWLAYAVSAAAFVVLATVVLCFTSASGRWALALLAGAWLTLPVAINAFTAPTAGLSWQGRYALPLIVGLAFVPMLAGRDRVWSKSVRWAVTAAAAAACLVEAVAFWTLLRRYTVGTRGKVLLTGELAWEPALPAMLLVALNVLAVGSLGGVVVWASRQIERGAGEQHRAGAQHRL